MHKFVLFRKQNLYFIISLALVITDKYVSDARRADLKWYINVKPRAYTLPVDYVGLTLYKLMQNGDPNFFH